MQNQKLSEVKFQIDIIMPEASLLYLKISESSQKNEQSVLIQNIKSLQKTHFVFFKVNPSIHYKYKYSIERNNIITAESCFRPFKYINSQENKIDIWNEIWIEYRMCTNDNFFNENRVIVIDSKGTRLELIKLGNSTKYGKCQLIPNGKQFDQQIIFEISDKKTKRIQKSELLKISNFAEKQFSERNVLIFEFSKEQLFSHAFRQAPPEELLIELESQKSLISELQESNQRHQKELDDNKLKLQWYQAKEENLLSLLINDLDLMDPGPIKIVNQLEDPFWPQISKFLENLNTKITQLREEKQNALNKSEKKSSQLAAQKELLLKRQRKLDECLKQLITSDQIVSQYESQVKIQNQCNEQKVQIIKSLRNLLKNKETELLAYRQRVSQLLEEQENLEEGLKRIRLEQDKAQKCFAQLEQQLIQTISEKDLRINNLKEENQSNIVAQYEFKGQIQEFMWHKAQLDGFQRDKQEKIQSLIEEAEEKFSSMNENLKSQEQIIKNFFNFDQNSEQFQQKKKEFKDKSEQKLSEYKQNQQKLEELLNQISDLNQQQFIE